MWSILPLLILLALAGCGATSETLTAAVVAGGAASVAVIGRTPIDAVYSAATGKDCSVVRLDRGQTYCRPTEPPPQAQPYCTRSLGVVDCWADPAAVPGHPPGVADGPQTLTKEQEANRTRTWP